MLWNDREGISDQESGRARNLEPGTRNEEPGTRNEERGTRNEEQGTRNKEQGTRNRVLPGSALNPDPRFLIPASFHERFRRPQGP
jgi:hypothetical protein